jgi:F-type H+-transporting ATPase subunit b
MGLDWFTVAVQIVNFLLLIWLLNKVLYKPVLKALARREAQIAARLDEAERKAAAAEAEKRRLLELQEELRTAAAVEMRRAREEADTVRAELTRAARREIEANREQWLLSLAREKDSFLHETSLSIADCFHELAARALRDLAGDELEKRIFTVFLAELEKITPEEHAAISGHLAATGEEVLITSAFVLPPPLQVEISRRLADLWGGDLSFRFAREPSLLAGIHVEAAGRKIKWDMGIYLEQFKKNLTANLERTILS